jgi:hypothetical protein
MKLTRGIGTAGRLLAGGAAFAAAAYGTYAGVRWLRYGHPARPSEPDEADPILDRFMPDYEVVERHQARVAAEAEMTLAAAREQDLMRLPLVRAIFRMRELAMGAEPDGRPRPRGLIAHTRSLGWGVLADVPGREIVMGAVTRPWEPDAVFRAVPAHKFAAFREPGYVKIAWTLRADPAGPGASVFRTETRATATDAGARARFRVYWALASPGIGLIRRASLGPLGRDAARRQRASVTAEQKPLAVGQAW